jgi:hypothetical protein
MKIDFIQIANIIFKDKKSYSKLSDKDKENNFFILNRKFSVGKYKQAQFFNSKFIDKASSVDLWYLFFKNQNGIPVWYWRPKNNNKKLKNNLTKTDKDLLLENTELNNDDIDFLYKYYNDELNYKIKKLKRFK